MKPHSANLSTNSQKIGNTNEPAEKPSKTTSKRYSKIPLEGQEKMKLKVIAYSTAEGYDINSLRSELLKEGLYELVNVASDADKEILCVKGKYKTIQTSPDEEPRNIFIFQDGTCVFWNVSDSAERKSVLHVVRKNAFRPYDHTLVNSEIEMLTYSYDEKLNAATVGNNHINLPMSSFERSLLEKYTFSDAVSLSVKLAIWEAKLESFIESIEHISEDLKYARKSKLTSEQVLQKTGELYTMRHHVNLRSDLLDTPDWYWDREDLETLYTRMITFLDIPKRTRVYNEKLNHCIDLMKLIESNMNDKKHTRLEWFIILLITIETFFGILSFLQNKAH